MTPILTRLPLAAAICVGSAGASFAQEYCAGIGSSGQWIGGTEAFSDLTTSPDYAEQMALVMGENEYIALFSLSDTTPTRIEAEGRGSGDPMIEIYDSAGYLVATDDDSGGGVSARSEITLDSGTYCVALRSYDSAPMTAFVRVGRQEHEPLTDGYVPGNDTGSGACFGPLPNDELVDELPSTATIGDINAYRFTLAEPRALTLTATNTAADPYITLYDGNGNYIDENDDWDDLNSRIEITYPLDAGDYCVEVDALSDASQPITVTLETLTEEEAMRAMYDRGEAAPPLDGSYPVTDLGQLQNRQRVDLQNGTTVTWYSLDIPEGGAIVVEAVSLNGMGDPYLILFDDFGREVAYNDDTNELDPVLAARVSAGTYTLGVGEYNDGTSPVRMILERFIPAK